MGWAVSLDGNNRDRPSGIEGMIIETLVVIIVGRWKGLN